jgi:SAM-dependent methyltransferase
MTIEHSAHLAHFEALYDGSDDPWNVRGAWYEQRKRALLLACLGKPRYRSVFEPGCGNGELSAALARRCGRLLACDGAAGAVAAATRRLRDMRDEAPACDVRIEQRRLPDAWPDGDRFDLVVVSELAYYFDVASVERMLGAAQRALDDDGELVMCHYLPGFDDRVTATGTVHRIADTMPGLARTLHHEDGDFLLQAWRPARPGRAGGAAP